MGELAALPRPSCIYGGYLNGARRRRGEVKEEGK